MLNFALLIGSTRPNRFADTPAQWLLEGAARRNDFSLTLLDLRDWALPFFQEPTPPSRIGGAYTAEAAEAWRQQIGAHDGFVCLTAEYNHGPTAELKNAFDSAFYEWNRKPIAFVGYGAVGGARAIEHMRGVAIELQMAPVKHEVNICREPFARVLQGAALDEFDYLVQAREAMFEHLIWWGEALKKARNQGAQA